MLFQNLIFAFALSSLGLAQDVDNDDIPSQCTAVCGDVVSLSRTCDRQFDNNDRGYLNCVCNGTNANTLVPICEACVSNFDSDRSDNDVNDLLRSCSFTATSYNPSATQVLTSAITGTRQPTITGASSGVTGVPTGSPTTARLPTQTTGSVLEQSTGAAPTFGVPGGIALGAMGVVFGML